MNKETTQPGTAQRPSGQLKLWAIILLSATPIIVAAYMYFGNVWLPGGTTNKGNFIIPPLSSELLGVAELHAEQEELQQLDGHHKWVIVVLADSPCDKRCELAVHKIRQVNIALGKDANRVGRVLLHTGPDSQLETLLTDYPGMLTQHISQARVEGIIEAVAGHDLLLNSYDMLLMDPLGNIMLHYRAEQDGKDLLEDLKRLLKVSKIG